MVDKMQRAGVMVNKEDDALMAEAEDAGAAGAGGPPGAGAPTPGGKPGGGNADQQAAQAAARARMQALAGKK